MSTASAPADRLHAEAQATVAELRRNWETGFTRSYEWRRDQIKAMLRLLKSHNKEILEALHSDMHKPEQEADLAEVAPAEHECINTLKALKSWMAPEAVGTPGWLVPAYSEVRREPFGVVLVIAPFNYPFQLAFIPLLNALAAGNCVVLKPSELTPATSALLARLLPAYVDRRAVRVWEGAIPETTALLAQKWDLIFFTGSEMVGKIVHQAAAKHLTPCILELGGKSPVLIDESVRDMRLAAKRIVWGKLMNAGQTCIAPDYMLIHRKVYQPMLSAILHEIRSMLGEDFKGSKDFGRIVSERHVKRLEALLKEASASGKVEIGGEVDLETRFVAPTVISGVNPSAKIMQEEIFGPLLPVTPVDSVDEAIALIKQHPTPLALYVFAHDKDVCERVMQAVPSGGVCLNDTLLHFVSSSIPFGGLGTSGLGRYHGKYAFDAFSHTRGVLRRWDHWLGDVPLRYAPYSPSAHKAFRWLADVLQGLQIPTGRLGSSLLSALVRYTLMSLGAYQLVLLCMRHSGR